MTGGSKKSSISVTSANDSMLVFNKDIYKCHDAIIITDEARKVMSKGLGEERTEKELRALRDVVAGMKLIHKGMQIIQESLCRVITYEKHGAEEVLYRKPWEKFMSCYYVLSGTVRMLYEQPTMNVKCGLIHQHYTGEYVGSIALIEDDPIGTGAPLPIRMVVVDACELLRIDYRQFKLTLEAIQERHKKKKIEFMNETSVLKSLPETDILRIIPKLSKQAYHPGKIVLHEGQINSHLYFLIKGRCIKYKKVFIERKQQHEIIKLGVVQEGHFFGECSILENSPSCYSVLSDGFSTCYLISLDDIEAYGGEHFMQLVRRNRDDIPNCRNMLEIVKRSEVWERFKSNMVIDMVDSCHRMRKEMKRYAFEFKDLKPTFTKIQILPNRYSSVGNRPPTSGIRCISMPAASKISRSGKLDFKDPNHDDTSVNLTSSSLTDRSLSQPSEALNHKPSSRGVTFTDHRSSESKKLEQTEDVLAKHIIEANEESKRQLSYAEDRLEDLKIGLRKKSADVLRDRLLLNSALDDLENDSMSSTPPVHPQSSHGPRRRNLFEDGVSSHVQFLEATAHIRDANQALRVSTANINSACTSFAHELVFDSITRKFVRRRNVQDTKKFSWQSRPQTADSVIGKSNNDKNSALPESLRKQLISRKKQRISESIRPHTTQALLARDGIDPISFGDDSSGSDFTPDEDEIKSRMRRR